LKKSIGNSLFGDEILDKLDVASELDANYFGKDSERTKEAE
jgi:hypothetical protein